VEWPPPPEDAAKAHGLQDLVYVRDIEGGMEEGIEGEIERGIEGGMERERCTFVPETPG
jgi:hypothetical protein